MKKLFAAGVLILAGYAAPALAQSCASTQITGTDLTTLLATGKLICGCKPGFSADPNNCWQEQHRAGGELWDYKRGPAPAEKVDPSEKVGSWSVSAASSNVTHSYTGGNSYVLTVHGSLPNTEGSTIYSFCNGGTEVARAYILTSSGGCSSYPP